jgi:hypothetical protein
MIYAFANAVVLFKGHSSSVMLEADPLPEAARPHPRTDLESVVADVQGLQLCERRPSDW